MNLETISTNLNVETGDFYIKGKLNKNFRDLYLHLQVESNQYNFKPHISYPITEVNEDNEFKIIFNFNDLLKNHYIDNGLRWSCYLVCDGEKIPINLKTSYKPYISPTNNIFRINPHQNYTLIFIVDHAPLKAELNSFEFADKKIDMSIKTDLQGLYNETPVLSFKCRLQKNLYKYYESIDVPLKKSSESNKEWDIYHLKESLSIFLPYIDKYEFFDIFFEMKNDTGTISVPLMNHQSFDVSKNEKIDLHMVQPVVYKTNQLSLYIAPYIIFEVLNFALTDEKLIFNGSLKIDDDQGNSIRYGINSPEFMIKKRLKLFEEAEYYDKITFPIEYDEGSLSAELDLNLLNSFIKTDEVYDLFIRFEMNGVIVTIPLKAGKPIETSCVIDNLLVKSKINKSMNYSLVTICNHTNYRTVKVGVLGSCFSRTAFNSMEYFNPDYKKFYECTFSQLYHSSIPALTSKQLNMDILRDISEHLDILNVNAENKNFIKVDMEKSFFKDLKEKDVDYLIIDLYADVVKTLIKFPDGSYIGTFHISELAMEHDYELLSPIKDNNKYFEVFKEGLDKFHDEILKIIPEDKIILNRGTFAYEWQDENGKINSFGEVQRDFFNDINSFWDRLNNYFQYKFPNSKVIDLSYTDYTSHQDFPFSSKPIPEAMHYESEYYRKFLDLLNKIVLEDKLEELSSYETETHQNINFEEKIETDEDNLMNKMKRKINSIYKKV